MSIYCINPSCPQRQNPDDDLYLERCQTCDTPLRIQERYLLSKLLSEPNANAEVFDLIDLKFELDRPKVLKVLKDPHPSVELFKREAVILKFLSYKYPHLGIPKVENDGYFLFQHHDGLNELKLHCLLMEKVEGINLEQWLQANQILSEQIALDWLKQLVKTLAKLHKKELVHRDIKPSNIMLKPDECLVLIDFGSVAVQETASTQIGTNGYTAPEQYQGQAVRQSDFYSLGRTFVHLLTGTPPLEFSQDNQTHKLRWRENIYLTPTWRHIFINSAINALESLPENNWINWAIQQLYNLALRLENSPNNLPQISAPLADLIDDLMAYLPKDRPQNAQEILHRLEDVEFPYRRTLRTGALVLLTSMVITLLVIGIRQVGLLQAWELKAYDTLMQLRPAEQPDPRILLVEINESHLNQYGNPIPDGIFAQMLDKLEQYKPRVIGLDIYRDRPEEPGSAALASHFQRDNNLIAVCNVPEANNPNKPGIKSPRQVPNNRIGFTDLVVDPDEVLRRHLLFMPLVPNSPCLTKFSFSSQIALHYLAATHRIQQKTTPEQEFQLRDIIFKPLAANTGVYQSLPGKRVGYQILLNYRASKTIAQQVTLTDILQDKINPAWVKDRIVLIGGTAPTTDDNFYTPYSSGQWPYQKAPGVVIQAHKVSQIISAVLDKRPLLQVWSQRLEVIWIWGWSVVGGLLVWRSHSLLNLAIASIMTAGVLSGVCFILLMQGSWVPLVPSALAFIATAGIVLVCQRINPGDIRRLFHSYVLEKVALWTNRT
ncbi:CHASE2 domain-containing protein [Microseira wollei]|uniref:non-specific serine/threonine protein kinase n=1 Tax=Microseira wollei NIES-4236 TaxID=2530354 RepID=A0AAV3X4Y2_9CYAN|nr:CHASE2 domain-containing protein [Microseira wollei]GET37877.1 serine/threonine protein kinase with Chase2 sensor [Microseira wollei NIES-4236]